MSLAPTKTRSALDVSDITGAQPKRLVTDRPTRTHGHSLDVRDIDGAFPHDPCHFLMTKRHTNPLNPKYNLPSYEVAPHVDTSKFIRDPLEVKDINKAPTITSRRRVTENTTRDPMDYSDVNGTRPNAFRKRMQRRSSFIRDNLDVTDILKGDRLRSQRCTNPLNPTYDYPLPKDPPKPQILDQRPVRSPPFGLFQVESDERFYRKEINNPSRFFSARSPNCTAQRSQSAGAFVHRPGTSSGRMQQDPSLRENDTQILVLNDHETHLPLPVHNKGDSRPSTSGAASLLSVSRGSRISSRGRNESLAEQARRIEREEEIRQVRMLS